jgi:YesN/AraC family two-component response regulator
MYQVILVDDEYYVRKSIQNRVDWGKLGCEIIAEAENGVRALELINEFEPDIVLVDIMMPEMDGLELIRLARMISPETQFAILSGYDDFLYTKEAIKLKVTDYIKKPVDVAELERAIKEMIRLIEASSLERQRFSELEDQARDLTGLKIERALNEVCASAEAAPALQELLGDGTYAWIILYHAASPESASAQAQDRLKLDLQRHLQAVHSPNCYAAANEADANEIRLLISAASAEAVARTAEALFDFLNSHPATDQAAHFWLVYSQPAPVSGLYNQYTDSLWTLKAKILNPHKGPQPSQGVNAPRQDEINTVLSLLESIKRIIAVRQFNKLDHVLDQLFSDRLITSPQVLEDALFYLYGFFREYALRYNVKLPEEYALSMTGSHALLQYDSLQSVKEQVSSLLFMFVCEGCPIDDEHITSQVKKYIEENYAEKISLKSIAGLFYLNASYLSSLFKQRTGVNLNKYVETIRIDRAKILLTSLEDATVNDIASMIGYADPNYFTKAFKKRTGMTPVEYKTAR